MPVRSIISLFGAIITLTFIFGFDSKNWITGSLLAVLIISAVIFVSAFFIFRRRSMAIFKEMDSPDVNWIFTEENILGASDVGKSEFRWELIKRIVKSDNIWLFVYKNNSYSTFPLANVPNGILEFISKKIEG